MSNDPADHPTGNPDGITNATDNYAPRTQEEKAALLGVEMVAPVEIAPEEPYPDGDPDVDIEALLARIRTPRERTPAAEWEAGSIANLAAGGAVATEQKT